MSIKTLKMSELTPSIQPLKERVDDSDNAILQLISIRPTFA